MPLTRQHEDLYQNEVVAQSVASQLDLSRLPALYQEPWNIPRSLPHVDPLFRQPLTRQVLCSVANNFSGAGSIPVDKLFVILNESETLRLIQYLHVVPGWASAALVENLLPSAIEARNFKIFAALMSRGIDPNYTMSSNLGYRPTLIERSSALRDIAMTRFLISLGADPNRSKLDYDKPALEHALYPQRGCRVDPELIRVIVDAGAIVTIAALDWAIKDEQREALLEILLPRCQKLDCSKWFQQTTLTSMLKYLDPPSVFDVVNMTVQRMSDGERSRHEVKKGLKRAMKLAADKGYLSLVQDLAVFVKPSKYTLAHAVRSGNKDLVNYLVKAGASVNTPKKSNIGCEEWELVSSPLGEAILAKDRELRAFFEEMGAYHAISQEVPKLGTDEQGWLFEGTLFESTIEAAAKAGDLPFVQSLLHLIIDSDGNKGYLESALKTAIQFEEIDIALMLINEGANCQPMRHGDCDEPRSLITYALEKRNYDLFRRITETYPGRGSPRQLDGVLRLALEWGNLAVVNELCLLFQFDHSQLSEALPIAVAKGDINAVEFLVRHGADAKLECYKTYMEEPKHILSLLAVAVRVKSDRVVLYLLSCGVRADDSEALFMAVLFAPTLIPVLLDHFSHEFPHGNGRYGADALCLAITRMDRSIIAMLLEAHVAVNCFSSYKIESLDFCTPFGAKTPLGVAICQDNGTNLDIVKKLLEASGDPNSCVDNRYVPRNEGTTALCSAISTGSVSMVELLLSYGARVDQVASRGIGRTPLQQAAESGSLSIVQLLLDKGVDVNEAPAYMAGGTALQLAAIGVHISVVCELLSRSAHVHAPGSKANGRTAFQGAAEHGRIDTLQILWNHSASLRRHTGEDFSTKEIERAKRLAENDQHAARGFIEHLVSSRQPDMEHTMTFMERIPASSIQATFEGLY